MNGLASMIPCACRSSPMKYPMSIVLPSGLWKLLIKKVRVSGVLCCYVSGGRLLVD